MGRTICYELIQDGVCIYPASSPTVPCHFTRRYRSDLSVACIVLQCRPLIFSLKVVFLRNIQCLHHVAADSEEGARLLFFTPHCKPGEAYTRFITASCEVGPGTTHMWILDICISSLQILEIAARCVFHNSIFGLLKCHLYIEFLSN